MTNSCMSLAARVLLGHLWLLIAVTSTMADEYCTYTRRDHNQVVYRTTYCSGHCCDDTATRCCQDGLNWLLIGGIIGGVILVIVVIVVIVALCKKSNMKRARVQDSQFNNDMEMTIRFSRGDRQPNIYFVDPPPYSSSNRPPGTSATRPPAYPESTGRGREEGVEDGGPWGRAQGGVEDGGPWGRAQDGLEDGGPWDRAQRGGPYSTHFETQDDPPPSFSDYNQEKPWAAYPPPAYSFK